MSPDESVFEEARALPAAARPAFLEQACAQNPSLRARVEALLAGYAEVAQLRPLVAVAREHLTAEEKSRDRIGRYQLLEKIGEGGGGVVWLAEQEEPVRRRVALKVIKLGMDTKEVIARFEAERQALALMDHAHIAKVFDAGATGTGRPYFVMELVRGVPITRYCDEANLSTAQRLELFALICHAIQHAHEKGIIHRDIKPSNILVAQHDQLAVPKVIDFGVAKATQGRLTDATLFTAFAQLIGTPAYMSPEQAEGSGREIDKRSDVYSLGVLLYELLAGRPPFDPKSLHQAGIDEIRRIIREVEPPRPSTSLNTLATSDRTAIAKLRGAAPTQHATQLSGDLDWIVMHCLEKDRARRYATASELAHDLGRHLRHEPIVARPPSVGYRTGKLFRRHRFGFAAAAVVSLALVLGAVVSLQQLRRAERAEQAAVTAKDPVARLNPKSILVLPFMNSSKAPAAQAYFVAGLHQDLIAGLAGVRDVYCVPLETALAYRASKKAPREVARDLQVAFVLQATVRRDGQKVGLTWELTDVTDPTRTWSRSYERDYADIFTLQTELVQAIAGELKTVVSAEARQFRQSQRTENPVAYDLYLRARALGRYSLIESRPLMEHDESNSVGKVREALLTSAVILDPKFASAWAELALVQSSGWNYQQDHYHSVAARLAVGRQAMEMAVALAPDALDVLISHGHYLSLNVANYARAAAEFEKAARQQPNSPEPLLGLAQVQRRQGKWSEALANARRAVALDPANRDASMNLWLLLGAGRRYDDEMAEIRRVIDLGAPSLDSRAGFGLVRTPYYATGSTVEMEKLVNDPDQQIRHNAIYTFGRQHEKFADANLELDDDATPPGPAYDGDWNWVLHRAVLLAGKGRHPEVQALLEHAPANLRTRLALDPTNWRMWCNLGCIEAVLGHAKAALHAARRAVELVPTKNDHWEGPQAEENLAFVYAWTGDKTRAIEAYAQLLQSPHVSPRTAANSVHVLRHALWFAPLRGDPRWEELLDDPQNNAPLF